ncbi:MAG: YheT family hydrolase [Gemmataceae bacterium]
MSNDEFRPLPFLANAHLQTVLSLWLKGGRVPGATRRHVVRLPDGDCLVLHENTPRTWKPGVPVTIVIHGLTGSYRSSGVVALARHLFAQGVRVFRLDLRGAGAGLRVARRTYNAGCSGDVRAALAAVSTLAPNSPLWLVGTSLGGNVALKLAGELPQHPVPQLAKVAVLNPPADLHACVTRIEERRNRFYEWRFVTELLGADRLRAKIFGGEAPPEKARRLRLRDYDDRYTAPRGGFSGVSDYYTRASSASLVPHITVPTLILTSRDDPFIAVESLEAMSRPSHVELRIASSGGHTGFLGRDGNGGWSWAEWAIVKWLTCIREEPRTEETRTK